MHNRVLHQTISSVILNWGDIQQINLNFSSSSHLYRQFHYPTVMTHLCWMDFLLSCGINITFLRNKCHSGPALVINAIQPKAEGEKKKDFIPLRAWIEGTFFWFWHILQPQTSTFSQQHLLCGTAAFSNLHKSMPQVDNGHIRTDAFRSSLFFCCLPAVIGSEAGSQDGHSANSRSCQRVTELLLYTGFIFHYFPNQLFLFAWWDPKQGFAPSTGRKSRDLRAVELWK